MEAGVKLLTNIVFFRKINSFLKDCMPLEQNEKISVISLDVIGQAFAAIQEKVNGSTGEVFSPQSTVQPSIEDLVLNAEKNIEAFIAPFKIAGVHVSDLEWNPSFDDIPKRAQEKSSTIQAYCMNQNLMVRLRKISQNPESAGRTLNEIYRTLLKLQESGAEEVTQESQAQVIDGIVQQSRELVQNTSVASVPVAPSLKNLDTPVPHSRGFAEQEDEEIAANALKVEEIVEKYRKQNGLGRMTVKNTKKAVPRKGKEK